MKKFFLIIAIVLLLSGCGNKNNQLDKILEENNYVVMDVRTKEEYDEGHVIGALNISYDLIDDTLSLDKSKTILVYCKSGHRSKIAYDKLISLGYTVYDMGAYNTISMPKE